MNCESRCTDTIRLDKGAGKSRGKRRKVVAVIAGLVGAMVTMEANRNICIHTVCSLTSGKIKYVLILVGWVFKTRDGLMMDPYTALAPSTFSVAPLFPIG
jgi:nitrite reductase/ring-hydroxylating ferredoxin subunit